MMRLREIDHLFYINSVYVYLLLCLRMPFIVQFGDCCFPFELGMLNWTNHVVPHGVSVNRATTVTGERPLTVPSWGTDHILCLQWLVGVHMLCADKLVM